MIYPSQEAYMKSPKELFHHLKPRFSGYSIQDTHGARTPQKTTTEQTSPSERLDLRKFLSIEEVARITNLPIDTYNPYLDDSWEGGVYTSSNARIHTYFQAWFARKDVDGYDPYNVLSYYMEIITDLRAREY
jgi:hypothetical protein